MKRLLIVLSVLLCRSLFWDIAAASNIWENRVFERWGLRMNVPKNWNEDQPASTGEIARYSSSDGKSGISVSIIDFSMLEIGTPDLFQLGRRESLKIASKFRDALPLTSEVRVFDSQEIWIGPYLWLDPRGNVEGNLFVTAGLSSNKSAFVLAGWCRYQDRRTSAIIRRIAVSPRFFNVQKGIDGKLRDGLFKSEIQRFQLKLPDRWQIYSGINDYSIVLASGDPEASILFHQRLSINIIDTMPGDDRQLVEIGKEYLNALKASVPGFKLESSDISVIGDLQIFKAESSELMLKNGRELPVKSIILFFKARDFIMIRATATASSWPFNLRKFNQIFNTLKLNIDK